MLPNAADHVACVCGHRRLAVLLDVDGKILRLVDLVFRDDPWPECGEGIEALADVARIMPAAAPGVALAQIPANRVAENVIERALLAHVAGFLADDRAELAFEVDIFGDLRQDDGVAGADDRGG